MDLTFSSEDELDNEMPFAQRVALKAGRPLPAARPASFSDSEDSPAAATKMDALKRKRSADDSLILTPPPPTPPSFARSRHEPPACPLSSIQNIRAARRTSPNYEKQHTDGVAVAKVTKAASKQAKVVRKEGKAVGKDVNKALRDAEKLVNKQTEKGEVNKYLLCIVDPELVSAPPGADILNKLRNPPTGKEEEVFEYRVEPLPVPASLTWRRRVITTHLDSGEVRLRETWLPESRHLVFLSAHHVAEKIISGNFHNWATSLREILGPGIHITVMVYNFNAYFKEETNAKEKARKAAVRGESLSTQRNGMSGVVVSKYAMLESLLTMSINRLADYLTFDLATDRSWKECAASVFHTTRAVAEAPEKLKKNLAGSATFGFWAKADSKDCVTAKNLPEYWKQVIMQVATISLEKASAIAREFPSPSLLLQAYRECGFSQAAESLLANLEVRRVDTIIGGTRRLGEDTSRKIYLALTSRDPDLFLARS